MKEDVFPAKFASSIYLAPLNKTTKYPLPKLQLESKIISVTGQAYQYVVNLWQI